MPASRKKGVNATFASEAYELEDENPRNPTNRRSSNVGSQAGNAFHKAAIRPDQRSSAAWFSHVEIQCKPTILPDTVGLSFLSLPAEVRNLIYRLSVIHSSPIQQRNDSSQGKELKFDILVANRQIRLEATSIFYAENVFTLYCDTHGLHCSYPYLNRIKICHLYIQAYSMYTFPQKDRLRERMGSFVNALAGEKNLEYLLITAELFDMDLARELLEQLKAVRQIKHVQIEGKLGSQKARCKGMIKIMESNAQKYHKGTREDKGKKLKCDNLSVLLGINVVDYSGPRLLAE